MASIDVFLSYHRSDRESVDTVRQILNVRGVSTFLDHTNLTAGLPWPQALEQALRSVRAVAVFVGQELGSWQKREMYFALDRQTEEERAGRSFPVIPVLLPQADLTSGFLFLNTWVDLRNDLTSTDAIEVLVKATRGDAGSEVGDAAAQLCPYQGLNAFREAQAGFFFGREELSERLLEKVRTEKGLVAVIGPSGSGKSSVVQAGLLPLLRRQRPPANTWDAISFTPGQQPFRSFAGALMPLLEPTMTETDRLEEQGKLSERLAAGTVRIDDVAKRIIEKSKGTDRILIVIEQFEELMTLTAETERALFIERMVSAVGRAPLEFVVTLRADFYGRVIGVSRELSDYLEESIVNVGPMKKAELERAIVEPAKKVGLSFEPGLVNRISNDSGQEPGQLPLIQFALWQLWRERRGRLMTHAAYEDFGGVTKAINNFADAQLAKFPNEEQALVRHIFVRLVRVGTPGETGEDTRRRASLNEFDESSRPLIKKLADARLLVTARDDVAGEETVEVSHEALIREWKLLRTWLNDDREFLLWRQRLRLASTEWHRTGRDEGVLLRGALLTEADRWRTSRRDELNDDEREFIQISVAAQQKDLLQKEEELRKREQLRRSRMRILAAGLAIAFLLAIGLAVQWRRALNEGRIALARGLLSRSILIANTERGKFDQAALLAIESVRLDPTAGAEGILRQAIALLPKDTGRPSEIDCSPESISLSSGGSFIACLDYTNGTAKILTADSGKELFKFSVDQFERIRKVEASPNGKLIGLGLRGGFKLYNTETQPPKVLIEDATSDSEAADAVVAFSRDNAYFSAAVFDPDKRRAAIRVFSIADRRLFREFTSESRVLALSFSPDGRVLAAQNEGESNTKIIVFKLVDGSGQETVDGGAAIPSLALSRDASWIAVPELDSVRVTERGTKQVYRLSHDKRPNAVALSEDGLYTASGGGDGAARVTETVTNRLIALIPTGSPVKALAFTRENHLVLISEDRKLRTVEVLQRPAFESLPIGIKGISPRGRYLITVTGGVTPQLAIVDRDEIRKAPQQPISRWTFPIRSERPADVPDVVRDLLISGVIRYSFDEERIVATGSGYGMTAYDFKTQAIHHEPPKPGLIAESISGDGKILAWATATHIELLRAQDGTRQGPVLDIPDTRTLELSRDGSLLAVSSAKNPFLVVVDAATKKEIFRRELESAVVKAGFSSDGKYLATSSENGDLKLLNVQTRNLTDLLKGVNAQLLLFSNDGGFLVAGGGRDPSRVRADAPEGEFPFAIHLIETTTGKVRSVIQIAREAVAAAFSMDDRYFDVVDDTSLTRHYLRQEDLIHQTCSLLTRNLSQNEWSVFMSGQPYRPTCPDR